MRENKGIQSLDSKENKNKESEKYIGINSYLKIGKKMNLRKNY